MVIRHHKYRCNVSRIINSTTTLSSSLSSSCFSSTASSTNNDKETPFATPSGPWFDSKDGQPPMYKLFTDRTFVSSLNQNQTLPVTNPATNSIIGYVPETTSDECEQMISRSQVAYEEWKIIPIQQRQRIMFQYYTLLQQYQNDLIDMIIQENGKTRTDAAGDVFRGLEIVETSCQIAASHYLGSSLPQIVSPKSSSSSKHVDSYNMMDIVSYKEPLGVCVGICPFNFPVMIPLWMYPLALVCGNTFVLKPSEKTPSTSLFMAELLYRIPGVPNNTLQVIHGSTPVVQQLCTHPTVKAISFVGSNQAGEAIYHTGTRHGKRVQANLGAKNHAVIMMNEYNHTSSESSLQQRSATVNAMVGAAFGAAGQRCMAVSVILLVGTPPEADRWIHDMTVRAQQYRIGPGWIPTNDIGPLITSQSKQRILSLLSQAPSTSTKFYLDGRTMTLPVGYENGNFLGPTIVRIDFNDHYQDHILYREEIFGPVLVCMNVPTLDDAIHVINTNRYGNGTSIFTTKGATARYFTSQINIGQVGINVPIPVPLPTGFSFTGNKNSILGDVNFYGPSGIQFYTQYKTITSHWYYHDNENDVMSSSSAPSSTSSSSTTNNNNSNIFGGVTMPTMGNSGNSEKNK